MQFEHSDDVVDYDALIEATSAPARTEFAEDDEDADADMMRRQREQQQQQLHPLQAQTLLELAQGVNRDAALQQIQDKVYLIAVLHNFIALRLVTTAGGPPPHLFDSETRQL